MQKYFAEVIFHTFGRIVLDINLLLRTREKVYRNCFVARVRLFVRSFALAHSSSPAHDRLVRHNLTVMGFKQFSDSVIADVTLLDPPFESLLRSVDLNDDSKT